MMKRQLVQTKAGVITIAAFMGTLAALPASAFADEQPSVTPYRPSVSTPAALSAPGWLELEAGGQFDRGNAATRQDSVPYTLKLAFSQDWGIRLGGNAWVRTTDDTGQRLSGIGDVSVVLKRRFGIDDARAFGLEFGVTPPTGHEGLSGGKTAYSLNGIYSADLGSYHTDINLSATRLGSVDAGTDRVQRLWATSLSKAFNDRWGGVVELSGTQQRGVGATPQWLAAASCNVSKSMTLDAGVARSFGPQGPQWSLFSGVTVLVARLF